MIWNHDLKSLVNKIKSAVKTKFDKDNKNKTILLVVASPRAKKFMANHSEINKSHSVQMVNKISKLLSFYGS